MDGLHLRNAVHFGHCDFLAILRAPPGENTVQTVHLPYKLRIPLRFFLDCTGSTLDSFDGNVSNLLI